MERIQETAKEEFVKTNFAKNGIAGAFLLKGARELPDGPGVNFAIRHLVHFLKNELLFPMDLSFDSLADAKKTSFENLPLYTQRALLGENAALKYFF